MNRDVWKLEFIKFILKLFLLFLGLQLGGAIHWSWLWIAAPMWIPFIFIAILHLLKSKGRNHVK